MPGTQDSKFGPIEQFITEFADLKKTVAQIQHQITAMDAAALETSKWQESVDQRITSIDNEMSNVTQTALRGMESLSVRVTDLGVALAAWPVGSDVHAAMEHLETLVAEVITIQRNVTRLEEAQLQSRADQETTDKECKLLYMRCHSLHQNLWGAKDPGPDADADVSIIHRLVAAEHRLVAAEHRFVELERAIEIKANDKDVTHWLASKADVHHTHDRLVSVDGSATFSL